MRYSRKRARTLMLLPCTCYLQTKVFLTAFQPIRTVQRQHGRSNAFPMYSSVNSEIDDPSEAFPSPLFLSEQQRHQLVRDSDPDWYEEFVINALGRDFCETKWPLQNILPAEDPLDSTNETDYMEESPAPQTNLTATLSKENANITSNETKLEVDVPLTSHNASMNNEAKKELVQDITKAKMDETNSSNNASSTTQKTRSEDLNEPSEEIDTSTSIPESDKNASTNRTSEEGIDSITVESITGNDGSDEILNQTETLQEETIQAVMEELPTTISKSSAYETPVSPIATQNNSDELPVAASAEDPVGIKSDRTSVVPEPDDSSRDGTEGDQKESRIVIFQDSINGWTSTELENFLQLGYKTEELLELQGDTLSIILKDKIVRPGLMSLPAAWKLEPQEKSTFQLVEDDKEVEQILEALKQKDEEEDLAKSRRERRQSSRRSSHARVFKPDPPKGDFQDQNKPSQDLDATEDKAESIVSTSKNEDDESPNLKNETQIRTPDTTKDTNGNTDVLAQAKEENKEENNKDVAGDTGEDTAILYRDLRNELAAVSLSTLSKLGYERGDIATLQSEVISVVVNDNLARPKSGIPPQWRVDDSEDADAPLTVEFVPSMEEAAARIEQEKSERRARTPSKDPSKSGKDKSDKPKPQQDVNLKRGVSSEKIDNNSEATPRRYDEASSAKTSRRRNRREKAHSQGEEDIARAKSDEMSRRRKREMEVDTRRSRSKDGTPKRIYNAREQLNQRKPKSRPDPPDPNSPLWMDMETFRGLMRNEAELRLRILGDDWAPTIKQESDWRMNLYKNWLWTLHNGVGEPIVPPSRYERARKQRQDIQREEEDEQRRRKQKSKNRSRR